MKNMENKQTSIQWLIDQVQDNMGDIPLDIQEQAKQIHKEEIEESWNDGNLLGRNGHVLLEYSTGEQYYNETYGSKENDLPELRYKDGTPMRKYNSPKLQEIEMENKQTALEWLLYNLVYHNLVDNSPKSKLWELTEQAKQMEKKQLENARPQIISNCVIKEISDEEIKKAWEDFRIENPNTVGGFKDQYKSFLYGIKWYREQIKSKQ